MLKRVPKFTNKFCAAINESVGVRFTRIESAENFQDIFPFCLNRANCKNQDCVFKIGDHGKHYFEWPEGPVNFEVQSI